MLMAMCKVYGGGKEVEGKGFFVPSNDRSVLQKSVENGIKTRAVEPSEGWYGFPQRLEFTILASERKLVVEGHQLVVLSCSPRK